jgi:beta-1,2-mannobiose phosphorylase / 1,2-beta-oligomannan phosphorylase
MIFLDLKYIRIFFYTLSSSSEALQIYLTLLQGLGALERHNKNPILLPNEDIWWESEAVFNPAVLYDGNKVHMLYRAIGEYKQYISRFGYACSTDGLSFERKNEIALEPAEEYEKYGIEDPRLVTIDNRVYLTYVVLSDYVSKGPICSTALATTDDFHKYNRIGIITSEGSDNKDVVFFPEKINQKYLSLHRPSGWVGPRFGVDKPSIWIAEGNTLSNFDSYTLLMKPEQDWEILKIGAGPPPIKTKDGWLLIYHGVDANLVYRAGAALLDLNNPVRVIARTNKPILQPEEPYERTGDVNNVVFPTGACIIDERLHVYYGGADKVCCLAFVELSDLLSDILNEARK